MDTEGWKWRLDPQREFHDVDPWGSMKPGERALVQGFRGVKIDTQNIITDENMHQYGLVSETPWKWSVDADMCGLSKEVLVFFF